MDSILSWLRDRFAPRPWWMNTLMVFCAFMTFIYVPWDFFFKPLEEDAEAWFGLLLRGTGAKLTEPIHWAIYAAGMYGLWRMRPWMWPWAAVYAGCVTFGMVLWPLLYVGGFGGFVLAIASAIPFVLLTRALWNSAELFEPPGLRLRERYGQWALVTGASAGIGTAFVRALAHQGVSCVLVARREDRLRELAAELEKTTDAEFRVVAADLASPDGVDKVVTAVEDLDIALLINNAGFGYVGRFEKQDAARLREMVELNCTAPMLLTHRLLPAMIERGRGGVVIVGSVAGRQPLGLQATYAATKAFDILLGEALWVELRDQGVDVVVLQPGPVATEFEEVSGERRPDADADERPEDCVRYALEAIGQQPSVVSGGWFNWARANANRFLPRSVMAFLGRDAMKRQVPPDLQR